MLSQLDSYAAYMAHKVRSNFIEAEKAILKTIKELEDENTFDIETVGYVWCLHGEVCGDLKQFDRLRESFRVALKKTNNSPLVRLYYIRALVYHSIDFKFSLDMAGELANEINQLDPHNLSEGELPPNYYLTKINWYLSYAYCEVLDSDSLLLALNHLRILTAKLMLSATSLKKNVKVSPA